MSSRLFAFRKMWPLCFFFNTFMYHMDREKCLGISIKKRLNYLCSDSVGGMFKVDLWWFSFGITWNIPI